MRSKLAEAKWFPALRALRRGRAVGNPDAFPIEIHLTAGGAARGFLGSRAGKKRPVQHGQFRLPGWIRNGGGEEAGIFVIHTGKLDAVIRAEGSEAQTLPMEEVLRLGQGNPWAVRGIRRVSHQVVLERLHESDARVLAAAAVGPPLIVGFRLQCDAQPLDACGIAGFVEAYSCNANARVIASSDQPGEQIELTIRATNGSRVQDALRLQGITRLRLHHQADALQFKSAHQSCNCSGIAISNKLTRPRGLKAHAPTTAGKSHTSPFPTA